MGIPFFSYALDSKYGAAFLRVPVATIPTSLSEAYASSVGGDSVLYNPAGTGLLTYSVLSLSHNKYFEDINQEYISLTLPTYLGNFSVFYSVLTSGDITSYDENENIIGKTSSSHKLYGFTYSKGFPYFDYARKRIDPMLIMPSWNGLKPVKVYIPKVYRASLGFSVKKIEETLDKDKSDTLLFDFGGILVLPGHFHIGASIQNIGGKQRFFSEETKVPRVFRAGISKDFRTVKDIMNFVFMADYVNDQSLGSYFNFALEDDISRSFQIRIGYTTKEKEGSSLSFGLGITLDRLIANKNFVKGLRLDYAFLNYGVLGATHRIGFQMVW